MINHVKAYQEAHNQHDIEAVLGMMAEGVCFEVVGVWVKEGKAEIRSLEAFDTAVNGSLVFSDYSEGEDTVTVTAVEKNDWFRISGIGEVRYRCVQFTFCGEHISKMKAEYTPQSRVAITEVLRSVIEWAGREEPEHLEKLMPKGVFVYSTETGRAWMRLLRKWREAGNAL